MFNSKKHIVEFINLVKQKDLYPYFRVLEGYRGNNVLYNNKELVMMGSNNYLGLTHDPRVIQAAVEAVKMWGTGCTGSRLLNGNLKIHQELEENLADFLGYESCLVYASGFMANQGGIPPLVDEKTEIFSDQENHACIIEGCRSTPARIHVYKHSNMEDLKAKLQKSSFDTNKLIITDGVFSMKGEVAHLDGITDLAKQYNAKIYLDDAHGLGVIGEGGRGTGSYYNLPPEILMGTFSKSLASQGGYLCASSEIIEWIKHQSRTFIFSAGLSPANVAAANMALHILRKEPERVDQQKANAKYLRDGLKAAGLAVVDSETSIIPILIGNDQATLIICKQLLDMGVFTTPVIFPAVAKDQTLIRCSITSTHTKDELNCAIEAFKKLSKQIVQANQSSSAESYFDILTMSPKRVRQEMQKIARH